MKYILIAAGLLFGTANLHAQTVLNAVNVSEVEIIDYD